MDTINIEELKAKYGDVYQITVKGQTPDDNVVAYFRAPKRAEVASFMRHSKEDSLRAGEVLITNCFVGGDARIKTDDTLFLSAVTQIAGIIDIRESELVKL